MLPEPFSGRRAGRERTKSWWVEEATRTQPPLVLGLALSAEGIKARGESEVGCAGGGNTRQRLYVRKRGQVFVVSLVAHSGGVLQERSGERIGEMGIEIWR